MARVIWDNYREARANASRWSGVYWGLTFAAAVLSALAALVLKLETFVKSEGTKKDLAALLSVAAALMITISTSGDFQRKWQANRIAAAELERTGYEFLEKEWRRPALLSRFRRTDPAAAAPGDRRRLRAAQGTAGGGQGLRPGQVGRRSRQRGAPAANRWVRIEGLPGVRDSPRPRAEQDE